MTRNWKIVECDPCHLRAVARALRAGDAAELAAYGEGSPMRVVWKSWRASIIRKAMLIDGEPAVIGGVVGSMLGAEGMPWLLTTSAVERAPIAFVRAARQEVLAAAEAYPLLANYVHAPYKRAVGFLQVLGFTIDPPEPIAATGEMFHRFWLKGA